MRISTLGYVGKQGVKNIGRNKMFSIASIATMSACIFLFGLFFSIVLNLQHFVKTAEEGVAITVFFDEDATESQIEEIGKELRSRDDVLKVEYVSEDDAWNSFKEEYFGDNPELADGFKDDNPLAGSSSYAVYMKPQEDKDSNMISKSKSLSATQKELVKFAEGLDGVRKVNKSDVVANTLSSVNVLVGYVSIAIILILFGVSIFLISNTVAIGISVRSAEINIMKYVGATNAFIRFPFLVEGMVIGLISALIAFGLLWVGTHFLYQWVGQSASGWLQLAYQSLIPFVSIAPQMLLGFVAAGVLFGMVGSFIFVGKYLKV